MKGIRTGPPDKEETNRIKDWIRNTVHKWNNQLNKDLLIYGVQLTRDGSLYYSPKTSANNRSFPIFYEDHIDEVISTIGNKAQINIEHIISRGAKDLKSKLDKYIIGQDKAKKLIVVEILNHYRRVLDKKAGKEINRDKRNILLVGNTGVGKTYIVDRLAKELNIPFCKVNATSYTSAGYVGADVEDIIRKNLLWSNRAKGDVELAELGIVYIDEIDKLCASDSSTGPDIGGDKVQAGLLTLMEGADIDITESKNRDTSTKNASMINNGGKEIISTENILFILGGAFSRNSIGENLEEIKKGRISKNNRDRLGFLLYEHGLDTAVTNELKPEDLDLTNFGMRSEMIGRITGLAELHDLEVDDLVRILNKESEDSLLLQYKEEFASLGVRLDFTKKAKKAIAEKAKDMNTGARGLKSVLFNILFEYLYELDNGKIKELLVTKKLVHNPLKYLNDMLKDEENEINL